MRRRIQIFEVETTTPDAGFWYLGGYLHPSRTHVPLVKALRWLDDQQHLYHFLYTKKPSSKWTECGEKPVYKLTFYVVFYSYVALVAFRLRFN